MFKLNCTNGQVYFMCTKQVRKVGYCFNLEVLIFFCLWCSFDQIYFLFHVKSFINFFAILQEYSKSKAFCEWKYLIQSFLICLVSLEPVVSGKVTKYLPYCRTPLNLAKNKHTFMLSVLYAQSFILIFSLLIQHNCRAHLNSIKNVFLCFHYLDL